MAGQPRRWGYHRLADPWPARIVRAAGVRPGEYVLDIGAGDGALTAALVAAGARVLAIELHPGRARLLRARFADAPVRVVQADAVELRLPLRPFRVVANPPHAVSATLLRRLLRSQMYAASLVLPTHQVMRVVRTGARRYLLRRGLYVPRAAFRPAAPTDCAVLVISRSATCGERGARRARPCHRC